MFSGINPSKVWSTGIGLDRYELIRAGPVNDFLIKSERDRAKIIRTVLIYAYPLYICCSKCDLLSIRINS